MKVILSSGIGRLHFTEVNLALKDANLDRRLLCGLLPKPWQKPFLNILGRTIGKNDLYYRLARRYGDARLTDIDFISIATPEIIAGILYHLGSKGLINQSKAMRFAWRIFGKASCKHLHDIDIFHVRSGAGQGGAIHTARSNGAKIIVDHSIAHPRYMHDTIGGEYDRFGIKNTLSHTSPFWQLVLEDCEQADKLLVNSNFVRNTFVQNGYDPNKIIVEHLGIPSYFYSAKKCWDLSSKNHVELLFTGGFGLRKGVRCLLEALAILRKRRFPFRLRVAGDASEAKRFFSSELQSNDVELLGFLPRESLKELICKSDLYVFPTLSEGCAQSAMEALGAGLPVITTSSCGLPGTPGEHYCKIAINDPAQLADNIENLTTDITLRSQFGIAGSTLLNESYSWPSFAGKLIKHYTDLISL
jgi:glycosyltransferase involved in cell wall biosynthesis